jgi:hypothetical protein
MAAKRKSRDIELAQRCLDQARKRLMRQRRRVARQLGERRNASAAKRLLSVFEKRELRAQRFLETVQGWHQKHPHKRFDKDVKRRLLSRKTVDKSKADKTSQWPKQVEGALIRQFPTAPIYRAYIVDLWNKYYSLGLPNAHFVSEICNGKTDTVAQRVWEMMLAVHFDSLGFGLMTSDAGPDLRIEHNGHVTWIEAVCPTASGLPAQWTRSLSHGEFIVGDVPHNEVLLRWTSAIDEKRKKLAEYRKSGLVGPEDSFVIAVNGGQLGRMPLNEGISQMPYAFEAVYPAGATTIEIDRATGKSVRSFKSIRPNVQNANGSLVPTTTFLDPANAAISAVIGYSSDRSAGPQLSADVVHNHLAARPVPLGLLGSDNTEWGKVSESKSGIEIGKLESKPENWAAARL